MPIGLQMWLAFGVVWFGTRMLDAWWPPHNPTFNAALAIMAALTCYAEWRRDQAG